MILLIDTSKPDCELTLYENGNYETVTWAANRELANDLLKFITKTLKEKRSKIQELNGLGVFEGPGSFTGLRIGVTVMNSLADALCIPVFGGRGDNWKSEIVKKIENKEKSSIVLPHYGSEAKITLPKK